MGIDLANVHSSMGQYHEEALDLVVPKGTRFVDESIPCRHYTNIDIAVG